jgi:DNA-binding NarL/FixJ family response regulator
MPIVKDMEDHLFHHTKRRNMPGSNNGMHSAKHSALDAESFAHQNTIQNKSKIIPIKSDIYRQNQGELTHREVEVLQLVSCGFLSKQIADKLSISLHTVISHRKNLTRKLQIKTVAGLTTYALLNGLITAKDIQ